MLRFLSYLRCWKLSWILCCVLKSNRTSCVHLILFVVVLSLNIDNTADMDVHGICITLVLWCLITKQKEGVCKNNWIVNNYWKTHCMFQLCYIQFSLNPASTFTWESNIKSNDNCGWSEKEKVTSFVCKLLHNTTWNRVSNNLDRSLVLWNRK